MSYSHSAFGLHITSNLPVPTLPLVSSASPIDVALCLGQLPNWLPDSMATSKIRILGPTFDDEGNPSRILLELNGGTHFYYRYKDGTEFVLDNLGTKVWSRWPDVLSLEDTATYLLGPIFGFLLRLRGFVCLHASAVVLEDSVAAFLGPAGAGKSTLAAAFADLGFPVVSDDVTLLVDCLDRFLVTPSYPCVRLWSDSASALYGNDGSLPLLTPNWDKLYLDVTKNGYRFQPQPLPLSVIYLLERGTEPSSIQELSTNEKIITLVSHSYANYILDREMRKREFGILTRLTSMVTVRRLISESNINRVSEICSLVIEDLNSKHRERASIAKLVALPE